MPSPAMKRRPAEGGGGAPAADPYAQARKALADRSPFDDSAAADPRLPAALTAFLARQSDSRRKHKKSHGDSASKKSSGHGHSSPTIWDETEEFFRPLTLADIELLAPNPSSEDSCLSIPVLVKNDQVKNSISVQVSSPPAGEEHDVKLELVEQLETVEEERPVRMEVDEQATCSGYWEESSSFNWIFGSRHRFILPSKRPNKKHKLLGGDAGLDLLLRLPYRDSALPELLCDVCYSGQTGTDGNHLLHCHSCKVSVHQRCYGVLEVPAGNWVCSWCQISGDLPKKDSNPCLLCPKEGGALKLVGRGTGKESSGDDVGMFAHLFCSLWLPEAYIEDTRAMEPILNIGEQPETRRKLVCYLCKVRHGICVRCSHGTCRTSFHPLCARESKHQMEIWGKFGCANVELRVFCSKHSSYQDNCNLEHSDSFGASVADSSALTKSLHGTTEKEKLPNTSLSFINRDKCTMQAGVLNTPEQNTLSGRLSLEDGDRKLSKNNGGNGVVGSGSNIRSSPDIRQILNKLIGRGKIKVDDVASEIGISSDSLEAALVGETSSFSPGLRLKISKWLRDSAYIWNFKSNSTVSSGDGIIEVDGMNAAKVTESFVLDDDGVAGQGTPDTDVVKPLPQPRARTKSKVRILEDNVTTSTAVVAGVQQNGNGKLADKNDKIPVVLTNDTNGDVGKQKSYLQDHDFCSERQERLETTLEGTVNPVDSSLPPGHIGITSKREINALSRVQYQPTSTTGRPSSFKSSNGLAYMADEPLPNNLEKACGDKPDDPLVSCDKTYFIVGQSCSSYIHPLITRRSMQVQSYPISNHTCKDVHSNDHNKNTPLVVEADNRDRVLHSSRIGINDISDMAQLDQLSIAKNMGLLELSPEDEVEGELLYLQTRLLDKAFAIKYGCEDLILRVAQKLPEELNASNKQRWDLIFITQFLRDAREAKKRGRKERRHIEAQAVLAAAAAAAAASSRNSLLKKETNDDVAPTHVESQSPLKASSSSQRARASSSLIPQVNDSNLAVVEVSSEMPSGISKSPDFTQGNVLSCNICQRTESVLNRIFVCSGCKVAVHLDCYLELKNPTGPWKCELCEERTSQPASLQSEFMDGSERTRFESFDAYCGLCGGATGAFRKSTNSQWVHAFCAEWLLESTFRRGQQNPVEGLDTILKEKKSNLCYICHRNVGVCIKCCYGHCQIAFHPSCARIEGLYMSVKANAGSLLHKAYCEEHSAKQREADSQEHRAEELKIIKQQRVKLEKERLLCERIIRREKLKRDLVLCAHDILASRRDFVAYSALVHSPFFQPGGSSESATTSINDKSYSGTVQRYDDVTIDSTAATGKLRLPLHSDTGRKIDDSSTFPLSFKRKFVDRVHLSGKQLPQSHASYTGLQNLADGEKRSKARKHTETFQKELVMTSDQASMQNQRLPKGFVYVPVGSLSSEKPAIGQSESHEPREPGG